MLPRPENMEAFFVRHAQEEAAYRHKVHEGRETLKKTSQASSPQSPSSPKRLARDFIEN